MVADFMRRPLVPLLVLGGVIFLGWKFWPAGEIVHQLDRKMDELVRLASKTGQETNFVEIGVARDIQSYFAREVELVFGPPVGTVRDRQQIPPAILGARRMASQLDVSWSNRSAEVAADEQSVDYLVTISVAGDRSGETRRDRRRFLIHWIREDGDWVIRRVELQEVEESGLLR